MMPARTKVMMPARTKVMTPRGVITAIAGPVTTRKTAQSGQFPLNTTRIRPDSEGYIPPGRVYGRPISPV